MSQIEQLQGELDMHQANQSFRDNLNQFSLSQIGTYNQG